MKVERTVTKVTTVTFTRDEIENILLAKMHNRFPDQEFEIEWDDAGFVTFEKTETK